MDPSYGVIYSSTWFTELPSINKYSNLSTCSNTQSQFPLFSETLLHVYYKKKEKKNTRNRCCSLAHLTSSRPSISGTPRVTFSTAGPFPDQPPPWGHQTRRRGSHASTHAKHLIVVRQATHRQEGISPATRTDNLGVRRGMEEKKKGNKTAGGRAARKRREDWCRALVSVRGREKIDWHQLARTCVFVISTFITRVFHHRVYCSTWSACSKVQLYSEI